MPLVLIIKLLFKAIQPQSDFTICMLYFLCPAITIVIGLGLYKSLVILFQNLPQSLLVEENNQIQGQQTLIVFW